MKTTKELIAEVDAELNAVRAADMGLEALGAFAQEALNQQAAGDVLRTKEALENLVSLVVALRKAVPANVVPASAGPVGKSPREQFVEEAAKAAGASLKSIQDILGPMAGVLENLGKAVEDARMIASIKVPD